MGKGQHLPEAFKTMRKLEFIRNLSSKKLVYLPRTDMAA